MPCSKQDSVRASRPLHHQTHCWQQTIPESHFRPLHHAQDQHTVEQPRLSRIVHTQAPHRRHSNHCRGKLQSRPPTIYGRRRTPLRCIQLFDKTTARCSTTNISHHVYSKLLNSKLRAIVNNLSTPPSIILISFLNSFPSSRLSSSPQHPLSNLSNLGNHPSPPPFHSISQVHRQRTSVCTHTNNIFRNRHLPCRSSATCLTCQQTRHHL